MTILSSNNTTLNLPDGEWEGFLQFISCLAMFDSTYKVTMFDCLPQVTEYFKTDDKCTELIVMDIKNFLGEQDGLCLKSHDSSQGCRETDGNWFFEPKDYLIDVTISRESIDRIVAFIETSGGFGVV